MNKFARRTSVTLILAVSSVLAQAAPASDKTDQTTGATALSALAGKSDLASRRAYLHTLLQQRWDEQMRDAPEWASILGDKRFNDKMSDFSPAAIARQTESARQALKQFEALDVSGFSEHEKLNRDLMVETLRDELAQERFKPWLMPVVQNNGPHLMLPQMVRMLSFENLKDYQDYLARLQQVPGLFDQVMLHMRSGMQQGLMPPKFLLEKVVTQCEGMATRSADKTPFAQPLEKMPDSISAADQKRLKQEILQAIQEKILPTYAKLGKFVKEEYAPKGRTEVGIWALPDGAARYAFQVKSSTTTNLSADEIHQIGLQEVARIEAEMLQLAKKLGYPDLKAFHAAIATKPDLYPKSRQEIIDTYTRYTEQMYPKLTQLFGRLPKAKVVVRATEEFREKTASGAEYMVGSPDGSRPGVVSVNTSDFAKRSLYQMESIALHEGVPGHHMQISIAQELPELPNFRKYAFYTAYVEGWGLYAEGLGREVGAYQDPYSLYGHLQAEMLRAIRLVVDTGLHHKKWSRQQVVDFFRAHSSIGDVEVQSETDRYIVNPGQALGYKVGQLKILQLRASASKELGKQFDLRAFHDLILGNGALPLNVLESQVNAWVRQQKSLAQAN